MRRLFALMIAVLTFLGVVASPVRADASDPVVHEGSIDGVPFRVVVPERWNGSLLLWSHGAFSLDAPPPPNIDVVNNPATEKWLLDQGYALAASRFRRVQGWSVEDAMTDQIGVLDWFGANIGKPRRTISWGASIGGLTAILLAERNPRRFDGVISLCGSDGGSTGFFNSALDLNFSIKTLLAPGSDIELVRISDPAANVTKLRQVLDAALATPQGRARIALASAVADVPGRFASRAPTHPDVLGQVRNQYFYDFFIWAPYSGLNRQDLEQRAGGNPSWNTGVDYRRLLAQSSRRELAERAYQEAGLDLNADLARLNGAKRISPDLRAVAYLAKFGVPTGRTPWPVMTLHSTDDGVTPVENEQGYAQQVRRFGDPGDLRQAYVDRGYHCTFTASEEITVVRAMFDRIRTGRWGDTSAAALDKAADAFAPEFQQVFDWEPEPPGFYPTTPAFVPFTPAPFLRPFPF